MTEEPESPTGGSAARDSSIRDHLANERTLLAWQRTALTVVALGFVVDRLGLTGPRPALGGLIGLALILVGGAIAVAGALRFIQTERDIDRRTFHSSIRTHLAVSVLLVAAALLLTAYLLLTPLPA